LLKHRPELGYSIFLCRHGRFIITAGNLAVPTLETHCPEVVPELWTGSDILLPIPDRRAKKTSRMGLLSLILERPFTRVRAPDMSGRHASRTRGSARLVRISIRSFGESLELDANQKVKDWRRIKHLLLAQASDLVRLAAQTSAPVPPPQPALNHSPARPPTRPLLPSLIPLLGPPAVLHPLVLDIALPSMSGPAAFDPGRVPFPIGGFSLGPMSDAPKADTDGADPPG
jgi:hypothetical protein